MKTYAKFAVVVVVIVGSLTWLAVGGINETKTYYKEIKEVVALDDAKRYERLRVGGDVEKGSIVRNGNEVRFVLTQNELNCRWSTPERSRYPTRSATVRRRWPTVRCALTAC